MTSQKSCFQRVSLTCFVRRSQAALCIPARGVFPGWRGGQGAPSCTADSHGWDPREAPALILANCFLAGTSSAQAAEEEPASKVSSTGKKKKKEIQHQLGDGHPDMKFVFARKQ